MPNHFKQKRFSYKERLRELQSSRIFKKREIKPSTFQPQLSHHPLERLGTVIVSSNGSAASSAEIVAATLRTPESSGTKKVKQATYLVKKEIELTRKPHSIHPCRLCGVARKTRFSVCNNQRCDAKGAPVKKGCWFESSWLGTYALEPQLRPIIARNLENLIQLHQNHHRETHSDGDEITDLAHSETYKSNMENHSQFRDNCMILPITIGFDGFRPNDHSKIQYTPLYIRIEGIGEKENRVLKNVAVGALLVCRKGLSEFNVEKFGDRLESEVLSSSIKPWIFEKQDCQWKITLKPVFILSDMEGLKKVASVPNWQSPNTPCIDCDVKGKREGGALRFFDENWIMRKRDLGEQIRIVKENGRINSITRIAPPWLKTSDELHLWCEGLGKDILKGLITPDSSWKLLRIKPKTVQELTDSFDYIRPYRFSRSSIPSLSNWRSINGSEIREIMRILLPMAGLFGLSAGSLERVYLVLIHGFIYKLYGCTSKNALQDLKSLANVLHFLHGKLCLSTYTLKAHYLYIHAVEKVSECGNWRCQSTSEMERYHMELRRCTANGSVSPQNMMLKFFGKQLNKGQCMEEKDRELEVVSDGEDKSGNWKIEFTLDEDVKIPRGSRVKFDTFLLEHREIVSLIGIDSNWRIYSRCQVKSLKYTSSLWKNQTSTQAFQAVAVVDGSTVYGTITAFVSRGNAILAIFQKWNVHNPWDELLDELQGSLSMSEEASLDYIASSNTDFVEKSEDVEETMLIDAHNFVGVFVKVEFRKRVFAFLNYC